MAINPKIKQKAEDIRKKIFGSEVRESLASGIEAISEDVEATIGRQDYVEEQFQDVLDETTGKDVISAPELIAARNGEANLKTRLDAEHQEVTAQLQQTEQSLNTQLAETGSEMANGLYKKTGDQTAELNAYFNTLSEKGIRYANFNKNDEYIADGDLTDAYKVIKIGNAKINKKNPNNWFTHISKSLGSFSEKINSFGLQDMKKPVDSGGFRQFRTALSQNRPIKTVFFGDSITAASPDTIEHSTRVVKPNGDKNGYKRGTDGIVADNSYTYALMDMLKDSFPNTTFESNNYGVGGTRIDEWEKVVTYWGITQKWIDFARLAKPDVLVVAFGMNNNNFDNARLYAHHLKALIDYTRLYFSPIPDIVVVTTPRPIYVPGHADWGNLENQGGRFIAANAARAVAKEYGAYVCDVARLSDIKRVGLDYTRPIMKRLPSSDFTKELENVTENADGSYTFVPGQVGKLRLKGNYQKDFTLKVKLNFTTPVTNLSNIFIIAYNKTRATNFHDNRLIITPKMLKSDLVLARLQSALRISDHANWGNSGVTADFSDNESYNGQDVTLIISKRADKVEIRKVGSDGNEHVCLQDYADSWDVHGYFEFAYEPAGTGNTVTIKSIEIIGAEYPEYLPTLTENEMWGGFVDGDVSIKQTYGGNGVNHPSSKGINEVYVPALQEMVNDIVLTTTVNNRNANFGIFPVTETKSSAVANSSISYFEVDTKILSARLVKADGTTFKLNKNITGWQGYAVGGTLGVNEFGMFMLSDTQARLLINSPASDGWEVTTYQ